MYSALYESEGKLAKEVIPTLEKGLHLMTEDPERFKKFDSPNGWGKYRDALPWLAELVFDLKKYPNGIIQRSK